LPLYKVVRIHFVNGKLRRRRQCRQHQQRRE
jgi:hypothetical protein